MKIKITSAHFVFFSILLNAVLIIFLIYHIVLRPSGTISKPEPNSKELSNEEETLRTQQATDETKDKYDDDTNFTASAERSVQVPYQRTEGIIGSLPSDIPENEARSLILAADKNVIIADVRSREFNDSTLRSKLEKLPLLTVYVIFRFTKEIDFQTIHRMENHGFRTVTKKALNEYMGKSFGVFQGTYRALKIIRRNTMLRSAYLMSSYSAKGYYSLRAVSDTDCERIHLTFMLPHSKPGKTLLSRKISAGGLTKIKIFDEKITDESVIYNIEIKRNHPVTLFCDLLYRVDIETILDYHVQISGNSTVADYVNRMQNNPLYPVFTSEAEKIVFTEYSDNIALHIKPTNTLKDIWQYIRNTLDENITYDWDKRYQFFSGNLAYTNIRDMYMTTEELSHQKTGACPERSGLEAAIMRKIGIAARTSTRLFHMYIEVYEPAVGWLTTSAMLNEIPLCESRDGAQSYFADWKPAHPIRLKWDGGLYPVVLY